MDKPNVSYRVRVVLDVVENPYFRHEKTHERAVGAVYETYDQVTAVRMFNEISHHVDMFLHPEAYK